MKHKHYEQILAFIEGKTVRGRPESRNNEYAWISIEDVSHFRDSFEYEIVPDKLVRYVNVQKDGHTFIYMDRDSAEWDADGVKNIDRVAIKMVEADDQDE